MKNLVEYIKESYATKLNEEYNDKIISELKVVYDVMPEEFFIQCPSSYEETDIQQYLDDALLEKLPSNPDDGQKFWGDNMNNLNDAYFEYDKFEHLKTDESVDDINLEWDEHFSSKKMKDDDTMDMFKITKLKYILLFDEFKLMYDEDNDDIEEVIGNLFKTAETNNDNEYPVEIQYNEKETSYKI